MRVIRAQTRTGFWLLFFIWLLVLVVPAVLFRFIFSQFLHSRFEQNRQRVKSMLSSELQQFNQDLDAAVWLQDELQRFDERSGFKVFSAAPTLEQVKHFAAPDAGELRRQLEKHLSVPVLAVFAHGVDTTAVSADINQAISSELKQPATVMLRRFFSLLNQQQDCAVIRSDKYRPAFSVGLDPADAKMRKTYVDGFIQAYFANIFDLELLPGVITRSIASKIGDTGPIYFYYAAAASDYAEQRSNLGGYLVAIRQQDIPEQLIVKGAVNRVLYPGFQRRFGSLPVAPGFPDNYRHLGLSGFAEHQDRFALQSIAPPRQILRLVQQGTIVPRDFSRFTGRTAMVEVSCPLEKLRHPLHDYRNIINLFLQVAVVLGSMLIMRLYLFGFDMNISLAYKISLAVVFAGILPLLSLGLSAVAYDDFARTAGRDRIWRSLKAHGVRVQQLIGRHLARREEDLRELGKSLEELAPQGLPAVEAFLLAWLESRPVNLALYKPLDDNMLLVHARQRPLTSEHKQQTDSLKLMLGSIVEMLLSSPLITTDPGSLSTLLTEGTRNVENTHSLMASNGRMLNVPKMVQRARMGLVLVNHNVGGRQVPIAVLGVVYGLDLMISELVQDLTDQLGSELDHAGSDVEIAIGEYTSGKINLSRIYGSSIGEEAFMQRQMQVCLGLKREYQWQDQAGGNERFALAQIERLLPVVSLFRMQADAGAATSAVAEILRWLYPFLVLLLTLLFSRNFFIAPALEFSQGLHQIAGGNFAHQLELPTGDEFEELARDFNLMAKSLKEKKLLESYVSSDVLAEASRATEVHLLPGGETVSATVVFASLSSVGVGSEPVDNNQLIARINRFLNLSHALCQENYGIIDKVIGQTLMLVFRAGAGNESHQIKACRVARQLVEAVSASELGHSCRVAVGLACGQLVSGKIGSRNGKLDFTVIGDTVNLAARLKSYAESLEGSAILLSDAMLAEVKNDFVIRPESEVQLKGKASQTRVYRMVC